MGGLLGVSLYHPKDNIDCEDSGHPSKRETLQDAAAGVRAIASLCSAVFLPERVQDAQSIQVCSAPPHRGRSRRKQLRVRHQHWTISEGKNK